MAPSDYIQARRQPQQQPQESVMVPDDPNNDDPNTDGDEKDKDKDEQQQQQQQHPNQNPTCVMIDDRPYYPHVHLTADDDGDFTKSCQEVVTTLLFPSLLPGVDTTLKVRPVMGGNTNRLFCVSIRHASNTGSLSTTPTPPTTSTSTSTSTTRIPDKVLVRLFGAEGLIDRDVETSTYAALAVQGLALPYYGRFGNGRLEGWSTYATCTEDDLVSSSALRHAVATQLGRLHSTFLLPDSLLAYHGGSDNGNGGNDAGNGGNGNGNDAGNGGNDAAIGIGIGNDGGVPPTLWTQLDDWMDTALQISNMTNEHDTTRFQQFQVGETWTTELAFLKRLIVISPPPPPPPVLLCDGDKIDIDYDGDPIKEGSSSTSRKTIGFCHNDVLASNLMWDETTQDLQLIDMEYGGRNYFAYEIANHFNEFAGGTSSEDAGVPKYDRFPSPTVQYDFCHSYLTAVAAAAVATTTTTLPPTPKDVQDLLQDISKFVLANHLVWALWAVHQAATEGCTDFDYLTYASCRMKRYWHDKQNTSPPQRLLSPQ